MYTSFFGLIEKPFAITPDPRYLYLSERHAEALAHLLYGINEAGGFIQLTGEVGTGKTTIVRTLLSRVPQHADVAVILNPRVTATEFLLTICEELGLGLDEADRSSAKEMVDALNRRLLAAHSDGRRVIVIVDEAQNLSADVLEQVRLLTNLETATHKLLQIILIGQPELRELLARNELRQLAQRITGRYHLDPLSREETTAYVRHRLRVAGATTDILSPWALREAFRLSRGVPRVINVLSDRALLGAYSLDRHRVTGSLVRRAAAEVFGRGFGAYWLPWAAAAAVAALLAVIAASLWALGPWSPLTHAATAGARVPGAAAVAVASAAPAASATPPLPTLAQLLSAHTAQTDTDGAFGKLFELWGVKYQTDGTDPCTQAMHVHLECLAARGSFGQLRLYNHPAILMLSDSSGSSHQVVLTGLDDEHARLDLGGPQSVGLGELTHFWLGDFVMLWRPASSPVKALSAGMRGAEVRWLRQSLQRLAHLESGAPASDVFDAELTALVREFQRQHQLSVDGIAGRETQIALAAAVAGPGVPLLSAADSHGG